MLTAIQIADWIVRFREEAAAPVDPMSLQKHFLPRQGLLAVP
jgi:hypothetical protein